MKRIVVGTLVLVGLAVLGCSSAGKTSATVSSLASNPLVSSLTSGLGLNANQAIGGAGALLGSAQGKLSPTDWKKVSDAVPGTDALVSEAKSLSGVTGNFGDVSSLGSTWSKLGLSTDQVSKLVPAVTSYVSKASPEAGTLLSSVLR